MAQLEAIRHEIGSISFINPGPSTRRHDNLDQASISDGIVYTAAQFNLKHMIEYKKFTDTITEILYNHVIVYCCIYRRQKT
jgi:hypothetical protein